MNVSHLFTFYILIFNNILIPIGATAAVDVSCYQSLFVIPDTITDRYIDNICSFYANDTCTFHYEREAKSTFDPPWIYSFQCSSSVFRNYISVYVAMYVFIGLVLPLLRIGIMLYFNECFTGKRFRGSWTRISMRRRSSSGIGTDTDNSFRFTHIHTFANSFANFRSSLAGMSMFSTGSPSSPSAQQSAAKASRLERKMELLKWIKSRVILYSMIRMCLPIQSVDDFLYENHTSTVDNEVEAEDDDEVVVEGVVVEEYQNPMYKFNKLASAATAKSTRHTLTLLILLLIVEIISKQLVNISI